MITIRFTPASFGHLTDPILEIDQQPNGEFAFRMLDGSGEAQVETFHATEKDALAQVVRAMHPDALYSCSTL